MAKSTQTYPYKITDSILYNLTDEYELSISEYFILYSFFVTYSCCGKQSGKKRTFKEYGWDKFARLNFGKIEADKTIYLKDNLNEIINLDDRTHFIFTTDNDDVRQCFQQINLCDGQLSDIHTERAVITRTSESSRYLKLFYRIRDGFAHGKFVLKLNDDNEKMIIIQDDDGHNVTGRIVIKLNTLIEMIKIIDKNNLLKWREIYGQANQ
ncbi:MAG: hypothetical protein K2H93_05665 [Oscillospiraceae bacterium]|nr:hypothetical protein [Oscillospiraceae bacterium]